MSSYNVDNMAGFLGSDCTDEDAEAFGSYLENNGWTLEIPAGEEGYSAFKMEDGEWREMNYDEWQGALQAVFS